MGEKYISLECAKYLKSFLCPNDTKKVYYYSSHAQYEDGDGIVVNHNTTYMKLNPIVDIVNSEERLTMDDSKIELPNGEIKEITYYPCMTLSCLQTWMRDEYNLHIVLVPKGCDCNGNGLYGVDIHVPKDGVVFSSYPHIITVTKNTKYDAFDRIIGFYEDALELGLLEGLKLIKNYNLWRNNVK